VSDNSLKPIDRRNEVDHEDPLGSTDQITSQPIPLLTDAHVGRNGPEQTSRGRRGGRSGENPSHKSSECDRSLLVKWFDSRSAVAP
jgi:hypothetical protein